jgi:hypothetical protein
VSKTGHLADPAVQGRLREQQKDRESRVDRTVETIMQHPEGRFLLNYIVHTLLGLEAVCLERDERTAALWEGRRWAAKLVKELLERAAPIHVSTMLVEARSHLQQDLSTAKAAKVVTEDEATDA